MNTGLKPRWQIVTRNSLTGDTLYTTEMPGPFNLGNGGSFDLGYAYESCLFFGNSSSEILDRYDTQEDAIAGHNQLIDMYLQFFKEFLTTQEHEI